MSVFHAAVDICPSGGGPFVFSECRVIPRLFISALQKAFCHSAKRFLGSLCYILKSCL